VCELKNYLKLWDSGQPAQRSILLTKPITVLGVRNKQLGPRGEFAKVQITLNPSSSFEVLDNVAERGALERLGVSWPDPVVFGLLDILMLAEPGPLYKVSAVLEMVWYHEVDSSLMAFRHAGRDAGRKVIEDLVRSHLWSEDY
jgi:translation elongation factor EF-G